MNWFEIPEALMPLARIAVIIGAAIALKILFRFTTRRLVGRLRKSVRNGAFSSDQRLMARTKTIAAISNNFATWLLLITATVMVLSELGIDVGALIAVSTILGAAIGFGAQSLVKDILSGIFIVFEDQYGVGDWIQVDDVSGEVERIGLRITEIRDVQGTLWFIRNGEIIKVGNSSQEWAIALVDLSFDYQNDVEQVKHIIGEVGKQIKADAEWASQILEDPQVLGLTKISGERFVIRTTFKTIPGKQWAIGREFRQRCKSAFDQAGIKLLQIQRINPEV
jgi:small conductance mechanosensitive channel